MDNQEHRITIDNHSAYKVLGSSHDLLRAYTHVFEILEHDSGSVFLTELKRELPHSVRTLAEQKIYKPELALGLAILRVRTTPRVNETCCRYNSICPALPKGKSLTRLQIVDDLAQWFSTVLTNPKLVDRYIDEGRSLDVYSSTSGQNDELFWNYKWSLTELLRLLP